MHLETHTKRAVTEIHGVWIDEAGVVLIESEHGIGLVDDRDLERLLAGFTDVNGSASKRRHDRRAPSSNCNPASPPTLFSLTAAISKRSRP